MEAISLVIGYLIGSLSPAYFLGRLLKGIDIRDYGDGNAGTVNVYRVLGLPAAVVTAAVDAAKGVIAILIARSLHVPSGFAYASGLMAVVGHVFPFYLNFRGGQGAATTTGMMLMCLGIILRNNWLFWPSLLILGVAVLIFTYVARKGEVIGIIVLPTLAWLVYLRAPIEPVTVFFGILVAYILFINILSIKTKAVFRLKPETKEGIKWSRFILRPLAILFPILYTLYGKRMILTLVGSVTLIFILMDAVRLAHQGVNLFLFRNLRTVFKAKETRRFSSMTMFLVACFLTFLLFERGIAITAVLFLIFGDMFGKFFGLQYAKVRVFDKTLEGSLAFFAGSLIAGYILWHYIDISLSIVIIGAIAATLTEMVPLGVDDNLTVSLISASAMSVVGVF